MEQRHQLSKRANEEFDELSRRAYEYLKAKQEQSTAEFKLGSYQRYDWDQEKKQLAWSDKGIVQVIADIQFVGSISSRSHTWLWSWANPTVMKSMSADMEEVRLYGETQGLRKLTEAKWAGDEVDGWEMTAIAAYILRSKGAYRSPDKNGYTFMVFSEIRWSDAALL